MHWITIQLDEAQYQRLQALAERYRERMNEFYAAHELPQLGGVDPVRYAQSRLIVAMEQDEEMARNTTGMRWPC